MKTHITVYENLVWSGDFATGEAYWMDRENGERIMPVEGGYFNWKTMLIRMAIEEFPEHPMVKSWKDGAYVAHLEKRHVAEAQRVLCLIPIPWAAGLESEAGVYHPECFRELSDHFVFNGMSRPRWSRLYTTWPEERICAHCMARQPPFPGELFMREVTHTVNIRTTDVWANKILECVKFAGKEDQYDRNTIRVMVELITSAIANQSKPRFVHNRPNPESGIRNPQPAIGDER